jgi:hypothetical protein
MEDAADFDDCVDDAEIDRQTLDDVQRLFFERLEGWDMISL